MADKIIGKFPEFTPDESQSEIQDINAPSGSETTPESGVEPTEETQVGKEKETPSEPSTEQEPATVEETQPSADTRDLTKGLESAIDGLKETKRELIDEIRDLRGQKREAKQAELNTVQEDIDKLEDINPADVALVERIILSRGFIRREDAAKMYSQSKKEDETDKFLKEYPEYSEENDPERKKFNRLLNEVSLYKEPSDPRMWSVVLRKAHNALTGTQVSSDRSIAVKKRQIEVAGVGAGGAQRSSSVKPFNQEMRYRLKDGGWSEEEIQAMEANRSE